MNQAVRVVPIPLKLSNAYLVLGEQPILVDSGSPGEEGRLLAGLAREGVRPEELRLILHTHIHSDHAGTTASLQEMSGAPAWMHSAETEALNRAHSGKLPGLGLRGRTMARILSNRPFPPFQPQGFLWDGMRLDEFGVGGQVLHTPGHTAGSVSLLLDSGHAMVGDLLMGGYLGGNLLPRHPNLHYFVQDLAQLRESLARVLAHAPHTLMVGHGGPLSASVVTGWVDRHLPAISQERSPWKPSFS